MIHNIIDKSIRICVFANGKIFKKKTNYKIAVKSQQKKNAYI